MTPKERFLAAMRRQVPDRVPVAPDISNFIPCKLTGMPFWDIYFFNHVPLWRAYLAAADHYGIDHWMASCTGAPLRYENPRVEWKSATRYDAALDGMVCNTTIRTPDGDMTAESICLRLDPPSPTEKPIKSFDQDWKKFRWTLTPPVGLDRQEWDTMRAECEKRQQAFGVCIGYPGFQGWMCSTQGGIAPLCYAAVDTPAVLDEWFEIDLANGTRAIELIIEARPDYLLFGGSGTITLASPDLAMKYAIPALRKWSAMTKAAGIPTMLHSCGKSRALIDMLAEHTDVDCINPLEIAPMGDVDLAEAKRARGSQIALMGNLHTTEVMLNGSPTLVRCKAIEAMRAAGHGGGFILSTGDQCGRETPEANIFALVETAKLLGVYDPGTGRLPLLD